MPIKLDIPVEASAEMNKTIDIEADEIQIVRFSVHTPVLKEPWVYVEWQTGAMVDGAWVVARTDEAKFTGENGSHVRSLMVGAPSDPSLYGSIKSALYDLLDGEDKLPAGVRE